jgi:hypothetical protein
MRRPDTPTIRQLPDRPRVWGRREDLARNPFFYARLGFRIAFAKMLPDVFRLIKQGDARWEAMVPPEIVEVIKKRGCLDCRPRS